MQLSDWQLSRLRNAIRAYHLYERSHDGDMFTWKDVSEAIVEYTGEVVPPERLRQFVEGTTQDDGTRKYPVPKSKRLKAIYDFATTEELDLLEKSEMDEFRPSYQAPLRMLEYLDQFFDDERILPPETIEGVYEMSLTEVSEFKVSEITLERPLENGLIEVMQTNDFYEPEVAEQITDMSLQQQHGERNSREKFGGWAILTPEDNLFFFLKNERNGRNRYYFTLASDLSHSSQTAMSQIFLLHHDYPLETGLRYSTPAEYANDIIEATRKNLGIFTRVT